MIRHRKIHISGKYIYFGAFQNMSFLKKEKGPKKVHFHFINCTCVGYHNISIIQPDAYSAKQAKQTLNSTLFKPISVHHSTVLQNF